MTSFSRIIWAENAALGTQIALFFFSFFFFYIKRALANGKQKYDKKKKKSRLLPDMVQ